MTLVTAEEVCKIVEENVKGLVTDPNQRVIRWDWPESDHIRQTMFEDDHFKIESYNILNTAHVHHLKPSYDSADHLKTCDLSQRLHDCRFTRDDEAFHRERQTRIIGRAIHSAKNGWVVCLQEVSGSVCEQLREMVKHENSLLNEEDRYEISTHESNVSASRKDLNLTLWNPNIYHTIGTVEFPAENCGFANGNLECVKLKRKDAANGFYLVNLHVKWNKNAALAARLKEVFGDIFAVVCGDFNASARYPDRERGMDHIMKCYADPVFKFSAPEYPFYSHVNRFENTKDARDMYDMLDHIIVMNHPYL